MATGLLDDAEAVSRFLSEMPGADNLRPRLAPGRRDWLEQYDSPTMTARYLAIDGTRFICFVVAGIALEDARRVAVATRGLTAWTTAGFHAAVEKALGTRITPTA